MKKKILSVITLISILSFGMVVNAENLETTGNSNTNETVGVSLSYTKASTYSVSIPKTIELTPDEEGNYSNTYNITVTGDVTISDTITVSPSSTTVTLKDQSASLIKKDDVIANLSQENQTWDATEINNGTVKQGNIKATGLSAGAWKGTVLFNITLGDI